VPLTRLSVIASLGFSSPGWQLWLLLALALIAAPAVALRAYRGTEPPVHGPTRVLLVGLRLLALWTVLALLAEPVLFRSRTVQIQPSVLFLVDNSASMAVVSADGTTRFEEALQLRAEAAEVLAELDGATPEWFGEGSRRLERSSVSATVASEEPVGDGTDLRALLVSATQRHLEDELAAILLFSDGQITANDARMSLAGLNVPVWAVATGDSAGPSDLGLSRVRYPSRVSRGDEFALDGEVLARASEPGRTVLRLRRGEVVLDSLSIRWEAGTSRYPFEFLVAVDSVGHARYELDLVAIEDENIVRNNRIQIGVRVEKERLRVLHLQSRPGWDAHFLRHAASGDRRIQWDTIYRTPEGLRLAGTDSLVSWPLSGELLGEIDLFVAGSPEDLALFGAAESGVPSAVRAGAGLWIVCGDAGEAPVWPASIRALAPLVPGRRAQWVFAESRVDLPAEARSHPVWALAPGSGGLDGSLDRLPPLQARLAPLGLAADADVLLRCRSGNVDAPVLAVRREGQGRVAVWSGAPLWSWSFWRLGDEGSQEFFRAMVGNLVTWMAEGGDRQRLRLQVPRPVVARGELFSVRALALDRQLRPDTRQDVWLEWAAADGDSNVVGRVRMAPDPGTPGGRLTDLPALPAGEYRLRATVEEDSGSLSSPWQRLTVDPFSVEYQDPRVDRLQLASLTTATGGELIGRGDFEEWARSLDLSRRESVLTGRIDLGSRFWLLIPLLLFLSVEWAVRKRVGLI